MQRTRIAIGLVVAVGACGGPQPGNRDHDPGQEPGLPYAAMFEPNRSWTWPVMSRHGHHERDFVTDATERATMTCAMTGTTAVGMALVGAIKCEPPHQDMYPGAWVTTASGLYQVDVAPTTPAEIVALAEADQLLPARPVAYHHSTADDPGNTEVDNIDELFELGDGWCLHATSGDELARDDLAMCFDATGPTGGRHLEIDGPDQTWRELEWGAPPPSTFSPAVPGQTTALAL